MQIYKKKKAKKKLIIAIIITVLVLLIAYLIIKYSVFNSNLILEDLSSRYSENSLNIKYIQDVKGDVIKKDNNSYSKGNISYIQIDGLKSKNVQEKINKDLKDKAYSIFDDDLLNDQDVTKVNVTSNLDANFANVLSIDIYESKQDTSNSYTIIKHIYLNYDLNTGKYLNIHDLFTKNTSLDQMIKVAINNYLKYNPDIILIKPDENGNYYSHDKAYENIDINTADVDEKADYIFNLYKSQKSNIDFYFSPSKIYFNIDGFDYIIQINMKDYYKDIVIYKKYLKSKSIYKDDNLGKKNMYVYTISSIYSNDIYMLDKVSDNIYVDEQMSYNKDTNITDTIINKVKAQIDKKIDGIKQNQGKDTKNAIGYKEYITIEYDTTKKLVKVSSTSYINNMTKEYFDQNFLNIVLEYYQNGNVIDKSQNYFNDDTSYAGSSKLYNNKDVKVTKNTYTIYYDKNANLVESNEPKD